VATDEKSYFSRSGEVWSAAANRRSAVTLVAARLVPTVGIQVVELLSNRFLTFRHGAARAPQILAFTFVEIALYAGQMKHNDIQRSMSKVRNGLYREAQHEISNLFYVAYMRLRSFWPAQLSLLRVDGRE
jgi:hypothetical protein